MRGKLGIVAAHGVSFRPGGDPPAGIITTFAGSSAPTGWLLCQGQEVSVSTYAILYAQIGTTYGSLTNGSGGAGSSHFKLPDFRGRSAAGTGTLVGDGTTGSGAITGSSSSTFTIATASGAESVTLTGAQSGAPAHTHTITVGSHNHSVNNTNHYHTYGYGNYYCTTEYTITTPHPNNNARLTSYSSIGASLATSTTGISFATNTSAASSSHENMQPYMVLNYIIKIS